MSAVAKKKESAKASSLRAAKKVDDSKKVINLIEEKGRKGKKLSKIDRQQLVILFRVKARKLGRSILRKWQARLDLDEVDSIVDLSLCEAAERFDPAKGASFITFLYYHLKGNLIRTIDTAASSNTVPFLDTEEEENRAVALPGCNALDIAESLNGQERVVPEELLYKKQLVSLSRSVRAELDPLEREVIERIFIQGQQVIDVAESLGYSRCHISRVKKKAIESLQAHFGEHLADSAEKSSAGSATAHRTRRRKAIEEIAEVA